MSEGTRDYSISIARIVAMIMVFASHFFDFFKCWYSIWPGGIGVGIFLCMSGYLYGLKYIDDVNLFYRKELKKIMIDYYVMAILQYSIIGIIYRCEVDSLAIDFLQVCLINVNKTNYGALGTLWFIPYILACYLITPILANLLDNVKIERKCIIVFFVSVTIINIIAGEGHYNSAAILCFIFGYVMRRIENSLTRMYFTVRNWVMFIAVVCVGLCVACRFDRMTLTDTELEAYTFVLPYIEYLAGCAAFFLMKDLLRKIWVTGFSDKTKRIIDRIDGLTYDIYLVHGCLIMGFLSLMRITDIMLVNILMVICVSIIWAIVVKGLSDRIRSVLK